MSDPDINSITTLEELDFDLVGTLVTPNDAGWDAARTVWNLAADQRPVAVVFAEDAADISAVVRFATETDVRVTAQSTGHLAMAVGDLSDTILIRTSNLDTIALDERARTVRVGAGATWGLVSAMLAPAGLVALAGSSPDVGVVGYTLGGGCSWLSRSRGLASSAVTAVEMVLASGDTVRATANEHPDLFWAVRGGGGSFGIVTALEFSVFPLTDIYAGMLLFPVDRAREVLDEYAAWTDRLDNRATTCARILRFRPLPEVPELLRGQSFVGVDGAIDAPDSEAEALLKPLRAMVASIDTFSRIPAASLAEIHMDPTFPVPAIGDGISITTLDTAVVDALLDSAAGDPAGALLVVDIHHLGGALGVADPAGGALTHLAGNFVVYSAGVVPSAEAATVVAGAVASVREALRPWAAAWTYSNFRETTAEPDEMWDAATLEQLRAIKFALDPNNTIRGAHPLETEPASPGATA
ncbi:FAD/FMN-containing dehydrogenase [Glaciihabitans tibetensis]|uniref:FAD/FMN-containing dehydrogenase n=1 Tax=Glaciihabitans tibetensis TaxID=1266600 RepID=A0A2T0VFY7_9MICO|nr:FAD-binding oxidoreductase [Glaciihabitans tibetensis]PRY69111.1 FAD/FMN-containing dehydrogenase [Glaciihabitans tibetensis]